MKVIRKAVAGEPGINDYTYIRPDGSVASRTYVARILQKVTGRQTTIALGSDLQQAKLRLMEIRVANSRGEDLSRFKRPRKAAPLFEPKPEAMTVRRYSEIYLAKPEIKKLRTYNRVCDFMKHINAFFGDMALDGIKRAHLFAFRDKRLTEHKVVNGKPTKSRVSRGEITNELSCLRAMLNTAVADEDIPAAAVPSFKDKKSKQHERLMVRHPGRDRILDQDENKRFLTAVSFWVAWVIRFARVTALNLGDCIEARKTWIDRKGRLIKLPNGRNKSGVEQAPYLNDEALAILGEIEQARRDGKIVANVEAYIFTKPDGSPISKDDITGAVRRARKKSGVQDYRFHDTRHEAQTQWSIANVPDAIAMKMAGLKSPQMRQRYTNIKPRHVAEFMANLERARR